MLDFMEKLNLLIELPTNSTWRALAKPLPTDRASFKQQKCLENPCKLLSILHRSCHLSGVKFYPKRKPTFTL